MLLITNIIKAQGDKTLTDGIRGGWTYSDGAWQGFISRDRLDVTIDLGKAICITSVEATFIQVVNPEVFLPCEVIVSFSTDGKNFVEAKREEYKVSKEKPVCFGNFGWTGCASTRYVRYQARSDKDLRGWLVHGRNHREVKMNHYLLRKICIHLNFSSVQLRRAAGKTTFTLGLLRALKTAV